MEVKGYIIRYREEVVRQDISGLSAEVKERIQSEIKKKLTVRPEIFGKPLRNSLFGLRSLRVGDYRIIFQIILPDQVVIALIQHRSKAYPSAMKRVSRCS